jgi:hypothetical protein
VEGLLNGVSLGTDSLGPLTADLALTSILSGTYDCGLGCNVMSLSVHFTLPNEEAATFRALFVAEEVRTVAEPRSIALLLLGLMLLAAAPRRRATRTG